MYRSPRELLPGYPDSPVRLFTHGRDNVQTLNEKPETLLSGATPQNHDERHLMPTRRANEDEGHFHLDYRGWLPYGCENFRPRQFFDRRLWLIKPAPHLGVTPRKMFEEADWLKRESTKRAKAKKK